VWYAVEVRSAGYRERCAVACRCIYYCLTVLLSYWLAASVAVKSSQLNLLVPFSSHAPTVFSTTAASTGVNE
jgi:hypothetical protein